MPSPALAPRDRQFLPPARADGAEAVRSVTRAATAALLTAAKSPHDGRGEKILREIWPSDHRALQIITRAATAPALTTVSGWAAELAVQGVSAAYLTNLAPSGASQLFARCFTVSLDGVTQIRVPYAGPTPSLAPSFVAEGAPIPVRQAALTSLLVGPVKKMAVICALTNELALHSAPDAEAMVRQLLTDLSAKALDAAVFSATPADSTRPAGIFQTAPITAATGGGAAAAAADVGALVGAIAGAGGGASVALVADYATAARLQMFVTPGFTLPVIGTGALAAKTLAAVDVSGIVTGFSGLPRIETGVSTELHFDDTNPAHISTPGSPNVVAAPVRSMFQTDSFGLRLTLDCAWAARPGFAQIIAGVTW